MKQENKNKKNNKKSPTTTTTPSKNQEPNSRSLHINRRDRWSNFSSIISSNMHGRTEK